MKAARGLVAALALAIGAVAAGSGIPPVEAAKKPNLNLDALVQRTLEASPTAPAKPYARFADRRTLFRRLNFDLTGLPPTAAETAAFLADKNPRAWSNRVDRLLASPAFGERWTSHWLEAMGYADVYRRDSKDIEYPEAWRYRDWVINAFNADLPYPQFLARQLAGDVDPALNEPWDAGNLIATGFLTTGLRPSGPDLADNAARQQVRLVGELLFGLGADAGGKLIGLTGQDEAGLLGIFRSVRAFDAGANPTLARLPLLNDAQAKAREERIAREKSLAERVESIGGTLRREYAARMQAETSRYLLAVWDYSRRPAAEAGLSPAAFAAKQGLNPYAFQRWQELSAAQSYALLTKSSAGVGGNPKVFSWSGESNIPSATINTTDEALQIATFRLAPRSVSVHPSPTGGVGVAWRSPISGILKVTGYVQDADSACGNGVAWRLARQTSGGETVLAKGEIDNGGGAKLGHDGLRFETYPGESLLFAIEPRADYSCDTTTLDLTLTSEDGKSTWTLSRDLVKEPLSGNPHADTDGRAGVWSYVDLLRKSPRPAPPGIAAEALGEWRKSLGSMSSGRSEIEKAAAAFQAQFKAAGPESPFWIAAPEEERFLPDAERTAYQRLTAELADLRRNPLPEVAYTHGVRELLGAGDSSFRRVPRSLGGPVPKSIINGSGRIELAEWLSSPEQPRPSRAWVNRVWTKLLGAPLSPAPGTPRAVAEEAVLTGVAKSFRTDLAGSTKALVRLIVHSRAYHQVSTPVTGTPRWAQLAPRQLSVAEMSDMALASVDRLDQTSGKGKESGMERLRRSVRLARHRSAADGALLKEAEDHRLDAVAAIVAQRILATSAPDGRSRIRRVYSLLLDRNPNAQEAAEGLRRLADSALRSGGKSEVAWSEYVGYLIRHPEVRRVR